MSDKTKVTVTCGANQPADYDVAGKTVGEAREDLGQVLNIPEMAIAMVGGEKVADTYVLKAGDELEFVKESGENG